MLVTHQSTFVHQIVLCVIPNNDSNSELNRLETFDCIIRKKEGVYKVHGSLIAPFSPFFFEQN